MTACPDPKLLAKWNGEQHVISSKVVVLPDPNESSSLSPFSSVSGLSDYRCLGKAGHKDALYGGLDVSFPNEEEDDMPSVAVYVVLRGDKIVYQDSLSFQLTLPYVSSYLAFREIEPYVNLVSKQTTIRPDITPAVILVDGNGLLHVRRAGIACFVGVKTGIPTIGVGKNFYHLDGLTKDIVRAKLKRRVEKLGKELAAQDENRIFLFVDKECIDPTECVDSPPVDLVVAPICPLAVKLRGNSGEIW
eukprot:CAMPEP_0196814054 /NCGR_PEP_ID=MMETSP1362-20130617/41042_1 /TAXON_ID=163516 /ORGANISM="Leptocylindrus danicus, Strain CCMP1856" /LENGTH=246 /DNA_ID=CAMNT_0042190557 /DNA_START=279 /DNA_END=1016 /DNA_ORIENTATION=-